MEDKDLHDENQRSLEEVAEKYGVDVETFVNAAAAIASHLTKYDFSKDTAGTMKCPACHRDARWSRTGRDVEIFCRCGWNSFASVAETKH